ncbi:electron transfer flavoprotein subunit alpha/FixB family protein [Burkholderia sp. LMG 21824]|uniref:electron transfer flavoprotein subunit alpha/FixB family protein n=1 Tax=Burkholderia sp. LMG 21824 TaxID=3158172 RepID=UPI003C2FF5A3
MNVLVLVEHDNTAVANATRNVVTAALQFGGAVDLLVAGHDCRAVAEQAASIPGVARVRLADAPHYADQGAENFAALAAASADGYSQILAPATTFGKNVAPRVAGLLGVGQLSDVVAIEDANTFVRPIYAGNALATVRSNDCINVITVRTTAFEPAALGGGTAGIELLPLGPDLGLSRLIERVLVKSERPELAAAPVVVSGGRGLGSSENFHKVLDPLADALNAALGASRAAVDAGYVSNDLQVGQTGKIVAPQLYVAIGISGAIQHLAGMKDSKVIVAVNKDPEAPIFQVADYGLVGDLFELVPAIVTELGH